MSSTKNLSSQQIAALPEEKDLPLFPLYSQEPIKEPPVVTHEPTTKTPIPLVTMVLAVGFLLSTGIAIYQSINKTDSTATCQPTLAPGKQPLPSGPIAPGAPNQKTPTVQPSPRNIPVILVPKPISQPVVAPMGPFLPTPTPIVTQKPTVQQPVPVVSQTKPVSVNTAIQKPEVAVTQKPQPAVTAPTKAEPPKPAAASAIKPPETTAKPQPTKEPVPTPAAIEKPVATPATPTPPAAHPPKKEKDNNWLNTEDFN